ncbi:Tubulin-folding cofactor A, partial [Mucuna pruriens]
MGQTVRFGERRVPLDSSSRSPSQESIGVNLYCFSMDSMATVRSLKIKTSTCKRIVKELHSYEKEVEREATKTADMKEKGADPYDLKQQENVLAESRMMIPDCRKRLEAALADLKGILAELEESDEKAGPEIDEARSTIVEVEKEFETSEV